ncbi:MAG: hypothetical protein LBE92_07230 [Chryseobacterium sp.]|jgi:antitoxin component YwqK of YwqJK toxin-antitoxin module|uniref:hypothetical protein n=1 Tax=Chryseobacterium sp. TaxID=1871047 RepID=UPI00281BD091|nr:hypothetical protein [Chryseobacterium sp.]MDR2235900.1 hypothetical protein [Chryseobacterium sp.]
MKENKLPMKKAMLNLFILTSGVVFSQQSTENIMIHTGNTDNAFFNKVKITDKEETKSIQLKDGHYTFQNQDQKADISIKNTLISGHVTALRDKEKTDFTIVNSYITAYDIFTDDIIINAYRDAQKAYFKKYDSNKVLKADGWMSLDKNKHYGKGVSKNYFENGKVSRISDEVTETYTDFYPDGNKKQKIGGNVFESYNENGTLNNKQYTKNNIRYNDYYQNGKLYTHAYQNKEGNEVTEYYKNGILDKKETVKIINGEKRLLTHNKAGKLISNIPYSQTAAGEIKYAPER